MEEQILNKIEAYLNGDLSSSEEQQFDTEIAQNPKLAKAIDNYSIANDAIEILIEDNLRKELEQLKAEEASAGKVVSINKNRHQIKRRSLRSYMAIAASLAILLGFFSVQWAGNNYSNEALMEEVYGYKMPNVRAANNTPHPFAEGLKAYQAQDFSKASQFFEGIAADDSRYSEAQFYLGHTLYQGKNYMTSAAKFKQVVTANDVRFVENAEWYQLLSLLAAGDRSKEFQSLLSQIANDKNHTFNNKAMQLQTKLGSFWRKLVF